MPRRRRTLRAYGKKIYKITLLRPVLDDDGGITGHEDHATVSAELRAYTGDDVSAVASLLPDTRVVYRIRWRAEVTSQFQVRTSEAGSQITRDVVYVRPVGRNLYADLVTEEFQR